MEISPVILQDTQEAEDIHNKQEEEAVRVKTQLINKT